MTTSVDEYKRSAEYVDIVVTISALAGIKTKAITISDSSPCATARIAV